MTDLTKATDGMAALAIVASVVINGIPAPVITGLDLFIATKFLRWTRIEEKLYETVTLIDWANPIQREVR